MAKPSLSRPRIGQSAETKRSSARRSRPSSAKARPTGGRNDLLPELEIEALPLANLTTARRPVRRLDPGHVEEIAQGIRAHGFVVPLLVTAAGEVIDGHARLAAARSLELERVPCIRIDHLSDSEIRTLRLALNRLQEKGAWDVEALKLEFVELAELEVDLSLTGFEVPEIDLVLQDVAPDGSGDLDTQANMVPVIDPAQPAVTRVGDLWRLGPHRLLCADARDVDSYARLLDGQRARLLFTDPPYNVKIQGHVSGKGRIQHRDFVMASGEMTEAEFMGFLTDFLRAASTVMTAGALSYLFMDWRHLDALSAAAKAAGLVPVNLCVWVKPNGGMGGLYRSRHELILVSKSPGRHQNNVQLGRYGRNRSNVWEYPGVNSLNPERRADLALHPTVKPVELVADAILDASSPGDIVLDSFLGSGTTLIAAEKTWRTCAGVELDPLYVDVAIRRWQDLTGESATHAETGQSFAALSEARAGAAATGERPRPATVPTQLGLFADQEKSDA